MGAPRPNTPSLTLSVTYTGDCRSLLSLRSSMQPAIRRLTTSLNNAGRYKPKVQYGVPHPPTIFSHHPAPTESHPRPLWITLSSVEVWAPNLLSLVSILSTTTEIYCAVHPENARCYRACGGARAFTTLSGQVDNTHRAAYTPWGGDEVSSPKSLFGEYRIFLA
jgi:hypothetical protein